MATNPRANPSAALGDRLHDAIDALLKLAPPAPVAKAIAAPTGSGALAVLLADLPTISPGAAAIDPLAASRARTALWRASYLERTPTVDAGEMAALLGLTSTEALRKRDHAGTILALPMGTGRYVFPTWQVIDGIVVSGLAATRRALGNPPAWTFAGPLDGLRDPNGPTNATLRELLIDGKAVHAVRTAEALSIAGGA